jgi:hypothetical protein
MHRAASRRQDDVRQDHIESLCRASAHRIIGVGGDLNCITRAAEHCLQQQSKGGLVIDNQNGTY